MASCTWEFSYERCESSKDQAFLENVSPEVKATAESMAGDLLRAWTGGNFGYCPFVLRPYKDSPTCNYTPGETEFLSRTIGRNGSPWTPALIGGRWYNLTCDSCHTETATGLDYQAVKLPAGFQVREVWVDGEKISLRYGSPSYATRGNYLIPTNGLVFPENQDPQQDYTEKGTFAIKGVMGRAIPEGGKIAGGVLALEIMRALCKDKGCALPERIQTVTRQGVSVGFIDTFEGLEDGKTGIWLVDAWVTSVKPKKPRSAVHSPDGGKLHRRYAF